MSDGVPTLRPVTDFDETTGVPSAPQTQLGWLAWSEDADDTGQPERQSWPSTLGAAAVIVASCSVLAVALGFGLWASRQHDERTPLVSGIPQTPSITAMPAAALPPIASEPPASPAPELKTANPAPSPPPTTTTVTVTPKAAAVPPTPSQADLDERYLDDLTSAGLRITNVREVVGDAHQICAYLAAGHSESDAARLAMRDNTTLTEGNAATLVDLAVQVYCPQF
jgi:Protein of unknown function (DUF732)